MVVTIETAVAKIKAGGSVPLFVNANNAGDYSVIRNQLSTFQTIKLSSYFSGSAKLPDSEKMLSDIKTANAPIIVLGLIEYLAFKDENVLRQALSELGKMDKRIIILCSHLDTLMSDLIKGDVRFKDRIIFISGNNDVSPSLTLSAFKIKSANSFKSLKECIASIEEKGCLPAMVVSGLSKKVFEFGLWPVKTIDSAYEALSFSVHNFSENFEMAFGTEKEWQLLYDEISSDKDICLKNFSVKTPDTAIKNFFSYTDDKKWLLLYLLKSSTSNDYSTQAAKKATSAADLLTQLYCRILDVDKSAIDFEIIYAQRKEVLSNLLDEAEMQKFLNLADIKGKEKIYYLTDMTEMEQKEFIKSIIAYDYDIDELIAVLSQKFPLLGDYLSPYYFGVPFWTDTDKHTGKEEEHDLGEYFERYKMQKLKNHVDEAFVALVNKFAIETPRKFIVEFPTRSMLMPVAKNIIWIDALGVEFLGYIVKRCDLLGLNANIQIARAEMPTLTGFNKEFFDESRGDKKVSELDDLKHSGVGDYDYSKTTLPLYIIDELKIIEKALKAAKVQIHNSGQSVTIISDHGASRLVRIYDHTITVDAEVDGKHGGRCCIWKEGLHTVSPYASDNENGYCVLANYDRFAGGKYTGVELHGGASLEEVIVPIITLSLKSTAITAMFEKKKIKITRGKAEAISVTLSAPVTKLRLRIGNKYYVPVRVNNTKYTFETDISKPQKCAATLLDDNQPIDNVELEFVSAVGGTTDLFS